MLLKNPSILVIALLACLLSGCSSDEPSDNKVDTVTMPVILAIPASDGMASTRAGDPGTYEKFKLPRYAYIYIVCKDAGGNDVVVRSTPTLDESNWIKTKYTGTTATEGDSIYQYNGNIQVRLPIGRQAVGKVYAALSTVPLQGLPTGNEGYINTGETEASVRNYQFQLTDNVVDELANIYSTPYNYRPDGTTYYGTMNDINTLTPSLNIVLYHVAAKLDILWNVDAALQNTTAIKKMSLTLPHAGSAYIFRPLESAPTTTVDKSIDITVGNQWYGRSYMYVMPLTGSNNTYTFSTSVTMTDNTTRSISVDAGVIIKTRPFTPWMRGRISITNN